MNDVVLFFSGTPSGKGELWRTDGTGDGTFRLPDTGWFFSDPATNGKRALFSTRTNYGTTTRSRLWQSDGTAAGTYIVGDLRFSDASVAATDDDLFAMLDGTELYRLDCGTLTKSSDPLADLTGLGDRLVFTGPLPVGAGTRIWTSDGSADGTAAVQDLAASPDDGQYRPTIPPQFTRAGNRVFFVGDFEGRGAELWALPVSALPVVDAPTCPPPPTPTPHSTPGPFDCPDGAERCTVLEISAVDADVGETVTITATLHASDGPIAGIQNDLAFSDGVAVAARDNGRPDCDAVPELGKEGTSFAFQPSGCMPGTDCTGLRAIVLSLSSVDPIPDGSALYTCTVRVAANATAGHHPLQLSNLGASDPEGYAVPFAGIDGAVEVSVLEGSHPSSPATADSGCQTAPSSSPPAVLSLLPLALLWLRRRR